jgi:hypothetical protein
MSKLPGDMTFSVLLNRSENFKPDAARLTLPVFRSRTPPERRRSTASSITALNDKISLKVDWFKTIVKNATSVGTNGNSIAGLGSNAYFIADGTIWGYGWAAALQDGRGGQDPEHELLGLRRRERLRHRQRAVHRDATRTRSRSSTPGSTIPFRTRSSRATT